MTIAGVDFFSKFCAKDPGASLICCRRSILLQRNENLPQVLKPFSVHSGFSASIKATQNLKLSVGSRRQRASCVNGSKVVPLFYDFRARRPLNPPMNSLYLLYSLFTPIVERLKRRGSPNSMVFSVDKAVMIDIQEKADGSVLFEFGSKEQLLPQDHSFHFLLQDIKHQSRDLLDVLLTNNSNQLYLQRLMDGRLFHLLCSENKGYRLISCNSHNEEAHFSNTPANPMILEQSGPQNLGEGGCSRVLVVFDSNVSVVKTSSKEMRFFVREFNEPCLFTARIDSLYESESGSVGRETSVRSYCLTKDDRQLKSLPCTYLSKRITAPVMPTSMSKIVKMKMPWQSLVCSENASECHAVIPTQEASKATLNFYGFLSQEKSMHLDMCKNIMIMPYTDNERQLNREDSFFDSAATSKIANKDNLQTLSAPLVPSCQPAGKRQLKKSGGKNRSQLREPMRKPKSNPRDLFCRSPFQVYELLLTYRFTNTSPRDFKYKPVKKACLEISNVLNQLAVGLAGSGLAIMLFLASRMLKLNSTFDIGKVAALLRGVSLIWLSTAIQNVRTLILKFYCGSGIPAEDQIRRLHREMKNLSVKALTVTALSIIGYVK
ncbi:hypothetical protein O6H91_22G069100 [Diphasiastrum complanatum]|uniref:Uncharacterized protein n=7 Tax=Diphasiastrum complanatum TaxID=34168 RepID=A0ACC2AGQ4_DIPCM|nr:hypothetical protein O6H91_22G069100 [Diphasiastrum complanatum]